MQRSLPLANQPRDPLTGKLANCYLSGVPIGLLPLLPMTDDSDQLFIPPSPRSPSPTVPSVNHDAVELAPVSAWNMTFHKPNPNALLPVSSYTASPLLPHLLPSRLGPNRQTPHFPFLPLLDTPSSSESSSPYPSNTPSRSPSPTSQGEHDLNSDLASDTDQSTPSLTNASLDSSPHSTASSCSPEPPFLQLPSPSTKPSTLHGGYTVGSNDSYFPPCDLFNNMPDFSARFRPSLPRDHNHVAMMMPHAVPRHTTLNPPPRQTLQVAASKPKKRNIIIVNDVEIELDDDDDEEPRATPESPNTKRAISPANDIDERAATPTIEDVALSETKLESDSNSVPDASFALPPPPPCGTISASPPGSSGSRSQHRPTHLHTLFAFHEHRLSSSTSSPTSDSPKSTTINESVNLHIPVLFKRGMQSPSHDVNRSASH